MLPPTRPLQPAGASGKGLPAGAPSTHAVWTSHVLRIAASAWWLSRAGCEGGAMSTAMPFDEDMTRRLVQLYTTPDVVATAGCDPRDPGPTARRARTRRRLGAGLLGRRDRPPRGRVRHRVRHRPERADDRACGRSRGGTRRSTDVVRARRRNGARLPRSELRRRGLDPGLRVRARISGRRWPRSTGCSSLVGGC